MDKQITIRAPKKILADWLFGLRSGKYAQATGALSKNDAFCCLGVLQMVVQGSVEIDDMTATPRGTPSREWLKAHGIEFNAGQGIVCTPMLPPLDGYADGANDAGTPFSRIADAIEACAEGY